MTGALGGQPRVQYTSTSVERQGNQVCRDRRVRCQLLVDIGDDNLYLATATRGKSEAKRRRDTLQFIVHHRSRRGGHAKSVSRRRAKRLRTKGPNSTPRVPYGARALGQRLALVAEVVIIHCPVSSGREVRREW